MQAGVIVAGVHGDFGIVNEKDRNNGPDASRPCRVAAGHGAGRVDFYKGKQIRFIVGTASGQEYDLWARLIGRHLTRHIAGNPTLIVENMPGAGHIIATNYLFNVAPKDGTVIGMVSRNMTDAAIMGLPNVRYDPAGSTGSAAPNSAIASCSSVPRPGSRTCLICSIAN